ncbi:transposase, partial [Ferruginivarius sediminum]
MRQEILTGVERRRRWSDEQMLAIVGEVGANGARVADIARRHDLNRKRPAKTALLRSLDAAEIGELRRPLAANSTAADRPAA